MPAIPSIASFTGASVTEGEFKTALSNLHLFLTGLLGTDGTQAGGQAALGALLGAGSSTKTASYAVASTDRGKVIACSGTFTVTLPDASAVGSGFAVAIANYGTGTVTVDSFSTQTLDGASTRTLAASRMMVVCAVAGEWLSVGGIGAASTTEAGVVQLSTATDSTSTTLAATPSAVKAAYDLAASKAEASHTHSQYLDTDIGHNIVGSLVMAKQAITGTSTAGSTLPGAALFSCSASGVGSTVVLNGTWRCLGYASGNTGPDAVTLWQRIS